ncbi:rab escort protein 1 [Magnolia sinica]|uniref:rab escort protein 1 n=1 Tax=Magnolia sinica TaxID=86752 RepID=UPI00265A51CB|nr:rab escort protein 1 [Magnolia sinica]
MADDTSASDTNSHPSIDPSSFDLIVVGTGLPESIIAASASSAGKSVLHLDPNPFYGSHFSSLSLASFSSFLHQRSRLYSHVEISSHSPQTLDEHSRRFSLDLSGPRLFFCADPMVDLILRSGASNHLEFKSVDASFLYREGHLSPVPDSREGIFQDRTLGLTEKSQLMRFFKLVREHFALDGSSGSTGGGSVDEERKRIPEEDLESPFVDFLQKQRLPPKIKAMILYAIAMVDYDQDSPDICQKLTKTKDGMESLALYNSSVGRFPNALGAFIYPIYGQGELPQSFCRCAAVKGALYVLRMPVTGLLLDEEHGHYKGVRLASGQELFSHQLVVDPSFVGPLLSFSSSELQHEGLNPGDVTNASSPVKQVSRGVCIIRGSIQPELPNLLVVFPPRSLYDEQATSVRALQLGSNVAVCPSGLFVLYLSTLCDDAVQGKKSIHAAVNALCTIPVSENSEDISVVHEGVEVEPKPILLWSSMYVQELTKGSFGIVSSCPMPDGNIDYRDLLELTTKLFHKMYPQEDFFPENTMPRNPEDDDGSLV